MKTWTPEEEAERLAARFVGVNQAAFARDHGVPGGASMLSQHIKGRRPLNLAAATAYAKGFGVALEEISPRLAEEVRLAAADTPSRGVAHDLSQARNSEFRPRIRWEELMTADLSRPFELEVIDDALAPHIERGSIAILDPARRPVPGRPVLVRDGNGKHYLRRYKAGAGANWKAVPSPEKVNDFDPLDSEEHSLTIIAVMAGSLWPDPDSSAH